MKSQVKILAGNVRNEKRQDVLDVEVYSVNVRARQPMTQDVKHYDLIDAGRRR